MGYKSIIVRIGGKIPDFADEVTPPMLNKALDEGYEIKSVHQIATHPVIGGNANSLVVGAIILTYVLYKES
ncbi:MAG: hypothetical protein ACRYFZ_00830 [Janthinobacterium lividum]